MSSQQPRTTNSIFLCIHPSTFSSTLHPLLASIHQTEYNNVIMRKIRIPFFRIFYSSTYSALLLIILILLAATPGDHVYQILSNHRIGNLFVIGGTYIVTALLALFIYTSRLYTNRSTLIGIPRSYLPIEKGEVTNNVRRMIVKNRQRSALIAWESKPRDLQEEERQRVQQQHLIEEVPGSRRSTPQEKSKGQGIHNICPISIQNPPWGKVAHPGWSSPTSDDLANLEFDTVICELPNLIEARAVSLAPPDPTFNFMSQFHDAVPPPPDPQLVAYLQRPPMAGLRDYLSHLGSLGLTNSTAVCAEFIAQYEFARFSDTPLNELQFRRLMDTFSELLAGMTALDGAEVAKVQSRPPSASSSMRSVRRTTAALPGASNRVSFMSASSEASTESVVHHTPSGQWRPP